MSFAMGAATHSRKRKRDNHEGPPKRPDGGYPATVYASLASSPWPLSSIEPSHRPHGDDPGQLRDHLRRLIEGRLPKEPAHARSTYVAMDCEMVGVEPSGSSSLARVSVVDYEGAILLDRYVRQSKQVVNYRTKWSGVRPKDLADGKPAISYVCQQQEALRTSLAPSFEEVQCEAAEILSNRIVVGQALPNDFRVLKMTYPEPFTRDTQRYRPLRLVTGAKSLKAMVRAQFGIEIQARTHDSVIDARASMALFRLHQRDWEQGLPSSHFLSDDKAYAGGAVHMTEVDTPVFEDDGLHEAPAAPEIPVLQGTAPSLSRGQSHPVTSALAHVPDTGDYLRGLKVHIIPAKLSSDELSRLSQTAETRGASLVPQPSSAEVVLTAVTAQKRLERHISTEDASKGVVARIAWLEESESEGRRLPFNKYLVSNRHLPQ